MNRSSRFSGVVPALITPFTAAGELNLEGLKANVEYLVGAGVSGLLACGSTGEAVALTSAERAKIIETTISVAGGGAWVVAGSGAPSSLETIRRCREAKELGADAALVITPFYLMPTQKGLFCHYQALDEAVDLPIIAYNMPAHTNVDISLETLEQLCELDHFVGLKESSGRGVYVAEALARTGRRIAIFEGADDLIFPSLCMGSAGCIVALANLAPAQLVAMFNAVKRGEYDAAREIYFRLLPVARAISASINFPAAAKAALEMLGRPAGPPRSPILPLTRNEAQMIYQALEASGLL